MNAHMPSVPAALAAGTLLIAAFSFCASARDDAEPATTEESTGEPSSNGPTTGSVAPTIEEELLQAGISPTIPALSAVLQDLDIDPRLRALSANGLGHTEDRSVVPLLLASLEDPEEEVRDAALAALFLVPDPRSVPRLRAILDDESTRGVESAEHRRVNALSADYRRRDALELGVLTGESFGYLWNVPRPEEWAEMIARVEAWWQWNRRYYE